jgi:hypothetical protein
MRRPFARVASLALVAVLLPCLGFAASLTLTWQAPTQYVDSTPIPAGTAITYNLYGALQGVSPKPLLTPAPVSVTTMTRANVAPGTQCYEVTAIIAGVESAHSAEVCKLVSPPAPQPPTITTIAVVAGLNMAPVVPYAGNQRAGGLVGFVPVGTACQGPVLFTFRQAQYRQIDSRIVTWWGVVPRQAVAAPCG